MGRRKIEIRPIKDDRNRSVTFLKRKGGLFKKAFELGVLCQVDVAVIIFGHNKKLYEFSSGDINDTIGRFQYYAGAHEHKGPEDFQGKGGGDDDEDDEGDLGSPAPDSTSPPEPQTHQFRQQPNLQHMRTVTPSSSPPLPSGQVPTLHRASPQPGSMPRPVSRTAIPRRPSNLAPPQFTPPQSQMTQPQIGQPSYVYTQNPQFYHQQQQQQGHARAQAQPHVPTPYQIPGHPPFQQPYMQDQRRQSLPPGYQQQIRQIAPPQQPQPQSHLQAPDQSLSRKHSPQPQGSFQSPPIPQMRAMPQVPQSHSIFTPIEDSRSLLAQHWGAPPSEVASYDSQIKQELPRSHSVDVGAIANEQSFGALHQPPHLQSHGQSHSLNSTPQRTSSASSLPGLAPPSRSNTINSDTRRPRLKVQIPSDTSDGGEASGDTSAKDTAVAPQSSFLPSKTVVLPPPSPSAGNPLLSAGASGPPNPFARPALPQTQSLNREMETPMSALPSRVMEGNMLPSPSDIWGSMFSRSGSDNMMPSPLNFQPTPVMTGASFRDEDDRKRRAEADLVNIEKRIRT